MRRINRERKKQKTIALILTFVLMGAFLVSCKENEPLGESGTIESVETSNVPDEEVISRPLFTKLDNPLDYTYTHYRNKRAGMQLEVPDSWNKTIISAKDIRFDAPSSDPFFPNATLHIIHDFNSNIDLGIDDSGSADSAAFYVDYFSKEIEYLGFKLDSKDIDYRPRVISNPADISTIESFTNGDTKAAALVSIPSLDLVEEKGNTSGPAEFALVACFVRWADLRNGLIMIVPSESIEGAKELLKYMASTATMPDTKVNAGASYIISDVKITLPTEFVAEKNIAYSPTSETNPTAGIRVGAFSIKSNVEINEENLSSGYLPRIIEDLVPGVGVHHAISSIVIPNGTASISGNPAAAYSGKVFLAGDGSRDSVTSYYGDQAQLECEVYVYKVGEETHFLVVIYQSTQASAGEKVLKMVEAN